MNANHKPNAGRLYRRKLQDEKAVSPVVATLLLILIAVAAAAALYLFVTSFQTSTQKTVGTPGTQSTLVIGGSTTVYPLDQNVVSWFEQNNTQVQVTNNQGGSGAGLIALCDGDVDIAPASEFITQAADIPQACLNDAVASRIGTSAVSVLLGSSAPGIKAVSTPEMDCIYAVNGGGTSSQISSYCSAAEITEAGIAAPSVACSTIPGLSASNGVSGMCYGWDDLPINDTGSVNNVVCAWAGTPAAPGAGCAAGAAGIQVYGRADNSGTSEGFIDQILDTSCSSNIITNCFPDVTTQTGESALTAAIEGNANAMGFVSTGYAATSQGGGLSASSLQTPAVEACATYQQTPSWSTTPCTLQSQAITAATSHIEFGSYAAWRPLDYYTVGQPTGESEAFISFVLQPYVDAQACGQQYFIPYTSGIPAIPAGQH